MHAVKRRREIMQRKAHCAMTSAEYDACYGTLRGSWIDGEFARLHRPLATNREVPDIECSTGWLTRHMTKLWELDVTDVRFATRSDDREFLPPGVTTMSKRATAILNTTLIASITAALVGCGGGGGGTSAATPSATTVTGTAAKGLVKQAKVLVCRIVNGAPEPDTSCVSTTTGSDGAYSVSFADGYAGPVMVKVMPTSTSMMVDESTGLDIPYNMTMRAVVPAVSGATTVYVTPFSEIAANAASKTTMNATSINESIAAVQTAMAGLGINLSVMPMMDLKNYGSNSTMLTMQSNMVKQLARVSLAARNSSLLTDANGVPCYTAGTTTSQQITCAVTAMSNMMSGYATPDPTKMATIMTALMTQNVTSVSVPIVQSNGTITMPMVDMTSLTAMQTAMQNAGMPMNTATGMMTTMMGGLR